MPADRIKQPATWTKAATATAAATNPNRNGNDNDVETAPSAAARRPIQDPAATATATIRTRSPRKMKTQIARLVYDPVTKPKKVVVVNENEAAAVDEDFQKKREDRDREVKEIQEMLNEITNTQAKNKKDGDEEEEKQKQRQEKVQVAVQKPTNQPKPMQRSKTETNLRPRATRRTQQRSEAITARSRSAQPAEKENPSPGQRQKGYKPEDARRYIQEQKKKRKSLQAATQTSDRKPAVNRTEIKKRLDDLRKNTRQILNKNVEKAKKRTVISPVTTREEKKAPYRALSNDMLKELEMEIGSSRLNIWSDRPTKRKTPVEKQQDPSPLSENFKKIGLLRKPEIKDHSFNAIKDLNMDKENLILDVLTPHLGEVPSSKLKEVAPVEAKKPEVVLNDKIESNYVAEQIPSPEGSKISEVSPPSGVRSNATDLDLKVPKAKLDTRVSLREKSVQVDRSHVEAPKPRKKNTDLPFWLKPTAVQAYPYNFIMAVRKKLEAIANPPAVASSSSAPAEPQPKKRNTETQVSHTQISAKRRLIDNEDRFLTKSHEKATSTKDNPMDNHLPKSLSEVVSNFSSISIQLPESNTVSSLKTKSHKSHVDKRKPLRFEEDDTTASSSVFSSPEKKKLPNVRVTNHSAAQTDAHASALSPLSVENISNLKIKSKSMLKNVTLDRGDNFSDTSSQRRTDTGAVSSRSEGSVDFSQLLDDFNRSLSQVIEVNHQLKSTLVKSHQIFSPEKKKPSATELKTGVVSSKSLELQEYVSDFEESSNAEEKQTKDSSGTRTSSSIPEVQTASNKSSATTQKPSSSSSSIEETIEEESQIPSSDVEEKSVGYLHTQTFIVPPEKLAHGSPQTHTSMEETLVESPKKENISMNQYSRDSLDLSPREEYIKTHINVSRGDFPRDESEQSAGPPPSYKAPSKLQEVADRSQLNFMNSSLDSEFVRVFNKSDTEISVLSLNRSTESTMNYSSIGLYEQLIQNETNKSEHLAALLKMREKALIDRTKGQIAWLEVQKERYKSKGLTLQISAVKKKQRGILLKMEKERDDIKKLLQQAKVQRDHKLRIPEIRPSSDVTLLQQRRSGVPTSAVSQTASVYQQKQRTSNRSKSSAIVRGYELETSRSLEQLLQKREEDLRRRREHVERLMEWHRRLDQEEAEVLQLERMLLNCNNAHLPQEATTAAQEEEGGSLHQGQMKMERKLKEIDRSLRELNSISSTEGSADAGSGGDYVRTTGSKLNKLWRRLTSQRVEKFEPNKRYKLCKSDLEQLYEEAKMAVLHDFGENAGQMEVFLGQASISTTQQSTAAEEVPQLNLNFSSGQSDTDMARGNYSPCAAEEEFLGYGAPSTSSKEGVAESSSKEDASQKKKSAPFSSSASVSAESDQSSNSGSRVSENSGCKKGSRIPVPDSRRTITTARSQSVIDTESGRTNASSGGKSSETYSFELVLSSVTTTESDRSSSKQSIGASTSEGTNAVGVQTDVVESAAIGGPSLNAESNHTSVLQSVLLSGSQPETESQRTSSVASASNGGGSEEAGCVTSGSCHTGVNSTASVSKPRSKTKEDPTSSPQTASDANFSTQVESIQTNSGSKNSSRIESIQRSWQENTSIPSAIKSEEMAASSYGSTAKSESKSAGSSTKVETDLSSDPNSNELPESGSTGNCSSNPSNQSTEGKASTSSVKTLQQSTSNGASEHVPSSASVAEVTSVPQGSNTDEVWSIVPTQSRSATEYIHTTPVSVSTQSASKEDSATLRSIKSIDNSTNSKHSADPITASNSSKADSPSIESDIAQSQHEEALFTEREKPSQASEGAPQSYSSAFEFSASGAVDTMSSNQQRSSVIMSTKEPPPQPEDSQDTVSNAFYESDFTEGEETNIDDMSLPKFETTAEEDQFNESQLSHSHSSLSSNRTDLEKRLIDLDISLKDLNATFERALSPEKALSPPREDSTKRGQQQQSKEQTDSTLMPDVISEIELRRRQQVMLENEMKQFEHAVPYMYVREIPNKPPPPYVPPAHGSPMTTIFPSEERIKEITYRRTKELYNEILNIDTTDEHGKKPPSLLDENITNIYERIILDICKEYLTEYESVLTSADPSNFHSPLAFFNPPDRLKCMQDFIYKEVRKSLAMDKNSPKRNQVYSVYGHRGKRDHIGEIIIQEMYEEDDRWSNFYVEEAEVVELIIDEMISGVIRDTATEVLEEEFPNDHHQLSPVVTLDESTEVRCNSST